MKSFKERLQNGGLIAPGAHDALSALLAQRVGFDALYVSGFAFEATQLAAPDMGVATSMELATHVSRLVNAVDANIIVDVDTGFGGPNSLFRTVREFERIGVSAIQIEDQSDPKRCPFIGGRKVLDQNSAVERIKLACEARQGSEMLIIARTDADVISMDEVVERCRRFAEAGADLVLPMIRDLDGISLASRSAEERMSIYAELIERIGHPIVTLDPPKGYTAQDLLDLGAALVLLPLAPMEAAVSATISYLESLQSTGSSDAYSKLHPPRLPANLDMLRVLGVDEYVQRDERFSNEH